MNCTYDKKDCDPRAGRGPFALKYDIDAVKAGVVGIFVMVLDEIVGSRKCCDSV